MHVSLAARSSASDSTTTPSIGGGALDVGDGLVDEVELEAAPVAGLEPCTHEMPGVAQEGESHMGLGGNLGELSRQRSHVLAVVDEDIEVAGRLVPFGMLRRII